MLLDPLAPTDLSEPGIHGLVRYASKFFLLDGKLMCRDPQGRHKVVIPKEKCFFLITQAHEIVGHRAIFSMLSNLRERFWWPMLDDDVKWLFRHAIPAKPTRPVIFIFHPLFPIFPRFFARSISTQCSCQPSTSFAISFRPTVPCHPGPSGTLFGRKMRRLLGISYLKISFAVGVEWPRLLLIMAPHLWLWQVTCPRNMASITSRSPLITLRPTVLWNGNTLTYVNHS